ncbi:glycosyltransferase [Paracidovorax wautersii]|uniref:UDP-GlcNAc:undecaprenyl-phosphate GlcNAc-1-phosphate transferase n=1 Tax=Paracidovorax wautersii TaxID=1177982 RepID=A0ABU1I6H9_9BURK|nr:glycosyltransferase [Paracidovorax wautersii]MDR6212827.1 UDP-GlcNAc:undecaprenyl-phosphate GlcNAc-1-phosphate transferase [Paracidovorax wautersii]
MIVLAVLSFCFSALTTFFIIRSARIHARRYGYDMPQRFHEGHVPRIGGMGIFVGLALAWLFASTPWANGLNVSGSMWFAVIGLLCMAPAVAGGLAEDVTQRLPAKLRLALTACSAVLLCWLLELQLNRVGVGFADAWLRTAPLVAAGLAVVAIAGLPHAFNLIDGYNGLAGVVALLISLALAHVALQLGDRQLAAVLICLAGATAGFLLWNYPHGKVFAGDGGAYVWGLVIAVCCILLVQRHPQVSPWFPVLLLIYPVGETFFSIYRKLVRGQSPGTADALHLHQLIFRRIVRVALDEDEVRELLARNNRTSPYLWMFAATSVVPAVLFWNNTLILFLCCVAFAVAYVSAYLMIIRFKVPGWLRM